MEILRKELMDILICPLCGFGLQLHALSLPRKDGILSCKKAHNYPIINGLPKILVGGLEGDYSEFVRLYEDEFASRRFVLNSRSNDRAESKQVQETFREKWTSKETIGIVDSSPYKQFWRDWMLRKYGWKDEAGFAAQIKRRRLILDAGAGLGLEVINLARAAPQSVVVGLELSDSAAIAFKNSALSSLSNACIVQGDIMRMPFAKESFDLILSEGVLHHTPDTREALGKCCNVLKKGGEMAFYVYRKKGPLREFADDYVRQIMQNATSEEKWEIARAITLLGKSLSDARAVVKVSREIPQLGIQKCEIDVQRFVYHAFLKCFWNDGLSFDENVVANFDWYVPKHAFRHTGTEIRDWCHENGIEINWFHEEESGYSVRGIKT